MENYPTWVCAECGLKASGRHAGVATWHEDVCDVCGQKKTVTEPRDFGYPNFNSGKVKG